MISTIGQRVIEAFAGCRTEIANIARNLERAGCARVVDTVDVRRYGASVSVEFFVEWVARNGSELVLSPELISQSGLWRVSRSVSMRTDNGPDHFETILDLPDVDLATDEVMIDRMPKLVADMLEKSESILDHL